MRNPKKKEETLALSNPTPPQKKKILQNLDKEISSEVRPQLYQRSVYFSLPLSLSPSILPSLYGNDSTAPHDFCLSLSLSLLLLYLSTLKRFFEQLKTETEAIRRGSQHDRYI